jgi:hypothetical protein
MSAVQIPINFTDGRGDLTPPARQALYQIANLFNTAVQGILPSSFAYTPVGGTPFGAVYLDSSGALTATGAMSDGQLLIGRTGASPLLQALTGTANRISVTNGPGTITLSAPQDIHTAASPTFLSLTLSSLTAKSFLYSGAGKILTSTAAPTNGQLLIGSTSTDPAAGTLTGTANQITVTNGAGSITLSLPQNIAVGSSPTFTALMLTGLLTTNGQIKFPATQNPSADANTLDDYEEGTFTPTANGVTLSAATGSYTKIGRLVFVGFDITWPATVDVTQAQITNLPFTEAGVGAGASLGFQTYATAVTAVIVGNTTLSFWTIGGVAVTNANVSTRRFLGSVSYSV